MQLYHCENCHEIFNEDERDFKFIDLVKEVGDDTKIVGRAQAPCCPNCRSINFEPTDTEEITKLIRKGVKR